MITVPWTIEALLDLIPPALLCEALRYQAELNDTADEWMPHHVLAAQQLCEYAKLTHPGCRKQADKLLDRLENLELI